MENFISQSEDKKKMYGAKQKLQWQNESENSYRFISLSSFSLCSSWLQFGLLVRVCVPDAILLLMMMMLLLVHSVCVFGLLCCAITQTFRTCNEQKAFTSFRCVYDGIIFFLFRPPYFERRT